MCDIFTDDHGFRRLEMLVNFRCFDLTGNDDRAQTHQNILDMFFYYYIYIIYFIILLTAWESVRKFIYLVLFY